MIVNKLACIERDAIALNLNIDEITKAEKNTVMIVNRDTHPERDVYYLGAKVIDILNAQNNQKFDYFEVFGKLRATEKISVNLYSLVLDWLFIIGVIRKNNKHLEKCF